MSNRHLKPGRPTYKEGLETIDRDCIFSFHVRHWSLSLFQLAAGGIIDDFVAGPLALATAPVSAFLNTVQGQAALVQQQFQDFFQSATQNLTSQLDFGLWQFEQNISALNGSSQADACNYNHTQQYYSIGNESRK